MRSVSARTLGARLRAGSLALGVLVGLPGLAAAHPGQVPGLTQVNAANGRAVPQAPLTFGKTSRIPTASARLCFGHSFLVGQIVRTSSGDHRCERICVGAAGTCPGTPPRSPDFWYPRTNAFGWRHVSNGELPATAVKVSGATLCRARITGANPEDWILGTVQRQGGRNVCATELDSNTGRRWVREARFDFIGRISGQAG